MTSNKSTQLHVRLTAAEAEALKTLSSKHGGTVADLVRAALVQLPGFREAQAASGAGWVETRQLHLFERARVDTSKRKKTTKKKRPVDKRRR